VQLGNGEDYKEKFDRLYSFYKQVWTKVGFEKYEKIAVQFKGQVVATKRGSFATRVDSAKAMEALNDLLAKTQHATEEAMSADSSDEKAVENINADQQQSIIDETVPAPVKQQPKTSANNEERDKKKALVSDKKAVTKADVKRAAIKAKAKKNKKTDKRQRNGKVAKAVMKKR
jgi:cell division protein FtsQ